MTHVNYNPQIQNEPSQSLPIVLRSNSHHIPRQLSKAFSDASRYFQNRNQIPDDIIAKLSEFIIDSNTFHRLVTNKESEKTRFVYLEDGRIRFDEYTQPPHGEILTEVLEQIAAQNIPKIFRSGSGNGTFAP